MARQCFGDAWECLCQQHASRPGQPQSLSASLSLHHRLPASACHRSLRSGRPSPRPIAARYSPLLPPACPHVGARSQLSCRVTQSVSRPYLALLPTVTSSPLQSPSTEKRPLLRLFSVKPPEPARPCRGASPRGFTKSSAPSRTRTVPIPHSPYTSANGIACPHYGTRHTWHERAVTRPQGCASLHRAPEQQKYEPHAHALFIVLLRSWQVHIEPHHPTWDTPRGCDVGETLLKCWAP